MAEPMTTMFGKAYDTVGSADRNLILQTRGDLKVKWGNKYIDLIKNGKINVDVDLLKKVDNKDSIYKDGVYLIEKEDKQEIWVSIGGTLVNLLGEAGTSYVSFLSKQDVKVEQKSIALSNIGFYYETLEDAQNAKIQKGIVFILNTNKFYYVKDGSLIEYKQDFTIPDPLTIGNITIDGASSTIKSSSLNLNYGDTTYINLDSKGINLIETVITKKDLLSEDYVQGQLGYSLFHNTNDNQTYLEIDVVKVRSDLIYDNIKNVTYKELKSLYTRGKLTKGKKYCITDFQNEWELQERYTRHNSQNTFNYYWPIVLTADTKRTFKKEGYFRDNENWIIEYDINFNYFSHAETDDNGETLQIYSKGRITKLTDEFGNVGNFDFKHRVFKYISSSDDHRQWYYMYNIQNDLYNTAETNDDLDYDDYLNIYVNRDASQLGLIENNTFYIKEPSYEDGVDNLGQPCKKLVLYDDYIIFPDCSTIQPYGNKIYDSLGKFTIIGNFYNNTFLGLYDNSGQEVQFTLDFHDNTFQKVKDCVLNAPMQYNIFDRNLVNVAFQCISMNNNHITGIIYTNNGRDSYPVQVANFNNNIINNINMSAINCSGCDIANNIINNINGCAITNSTLTDITMKDITGDEQYEANPTDDIDDSQVNPGGDTPVNPDPVNPDPVNPPSGQTISLLSSEPTATSINSIMTGMHNYADGSLSAAASSSEAVGTISAVSDSYGQPTVYGVYVDENSNMIDLSSTSNVTFSGSNSTGYTVNAKILANNTASQRKIHLWIQFADVNELGYFSIYQAGEEQTSNNDVDEYLNTFKSSSLASTSLETEKYSLLSTAMDKLNSFESNIMSDSMFVDDTLTLPSGNSTETRNARRGWYMALLLTALYPMKASTTVNNDILKDAMLTWGIGTWNSNKSTAVSAIESYSVSTYEARYKGLLQGSIAFSYLFSDPNFVNSFAPFASYSYRGDDGDLSASSKMRYYHAPKGQYFFPYPPTNNISATSGLMKRDEDAFKLGKTLRSTSRGTTASQDIDSGLSYYLNILQAATGKNNSSGNAYTLMYDTHWTGNRTVNNIKNTDGFWRSRPAWENNDTSVDSSTYTLNFGTANGKSGSVSNTTSYPSGHTGYFWNTAYCFMAIGGLSNSAIVNLFKRAYQYSESRVIVGAHWQMCVEMGRIAASCSFATLCGNVKFIRELQAAQS